MACGARSLDDIACGPGQATCGASCVALDRDPSNCGACGHACGAHAVCAFGVCVPDCGAGDALCGDGADAYCAHVTSDDQNCGACGSACPVGSACEQGVCGAACSGGLSLCDGQCVDLGSDASHCGACGTACAGTCAEGRCTTMLATTVVALDLAVDATYVYWSEADGSVWRLAKTDDARKAIAPAGQPNYACSIAADASGVYWLSASVGVGHRLSTLSNGKPVDIWTGGQGGTEVRTGQGYVYFMASIFGRIPEAALGDPPTQLAPSHLSMETFALDDANVYWLEPTPDYQCELWKMDAVTLATLQLTSIDAYCGGTIAVNGTDVFWWVDQSGTAWRRMPKTGGSPTLFAPVQNITGRILVDDTYAYVGTTNQIVRVPLDGSAQTVMATVPSGKMGPMAMDATSLYFVGGPIGALTRVTPR